MSCELQYIHQKQAICCCEFCSKGTNKPDPTGSTKAAIVEEKIIEGKEDHDASLAATYAKTPQALTVQLNLNMVKVRCRIAKVWKQNLRTELNRY
jgi:hypothetical protein